jgi:hypothetical protein
MLAAASDMVHRGARPACWHTVRIAQALAQFVDLAKILPAEGVEWSESDLHGIAQVLRDLYLGCPKPSIKAGRQIRGRHQTQAKTTAERPPT